MAKLVVEDQNSHIRNERRAGGDAESGRDNRDRKHGRDPGRGPIRRARTEKGAARLAGGCFCVLARYTSSEALTIVKSVTEMDGVRAWARLHANFSRRKLGRMFRVQRECMYPKPVKEVGQVLLAIMQWEEKWKAMMSELGGEQMLMRLDEIGENFENLKARVISHTTNKAEQARGGQKETTVPMELEYVSGSELYDEDWDHVDEVRRERRCYNCWMMGHFAKDCRMKGRGKGKGRDEGRRHVKGKGKVAEGAGIKGFGKSRGVQGEQKGWGYQGQCWTCGRTGHKSSVCEVDNVDEDDGGSIRNGSSTNCASFACSATRSTTNRF